MRTAITRLNAAAESSETRAVSCEDREEADPVARGSRSTCASQSLKNGRVPKSRHGAGGIECSSDEGGMNGAGSGLTHASGYGEGRGDQGAAGSESAGSTGGATRCAGRSSPRSSWSPSSRRSSSSSSSSWPSSWSAFFFVAFFFAGPFAAALAEQLDRLLERHRGRVDAARDGGVGGRRR